MALIAFHTIECNDQYFDLFNDLNNEEQKSDSNDEEQYYCVRKYVTEKALTEYTYNINPKKINAFGLDCTQKIAQMQTDAAHVMASDKYLSEKQKNCVKERFLAGNYFDAMAIAIALAQAKDITLAQINQERNKFIEEMKKMAKDCNWCVMNKLDD